MASRPRPGSKKPDAEKKDETAAPRTDPRQTATMGEADKGSRAKAENASARANDEIKRQEARPVRSPVGWPVGSAGSPMIMAEISAAELVPTGQYANVSVGPARLHFLIDPDREIAEDESYFTSEQRAVMSQALNEAAEIVESDVIAVQRSLVLNSLQDQVQS